MKSVKAHSYKNELSCISKVAEQRKKDLDKALQKKMDAIIDELGIDHDKTLTKREVILILELLGIELNGYQKTELEVAVERAHRFQSQSLKAWIMKHRNFVTCKVLVGQVKEAKDIAEEKKDETILPEIKTSKHSKSCEKSTFLRKAGIDSYIQLIKRNKDIKIKFEKMVENAANEYKTRSGTKGRSYGNKVKQRLFNSIREHKRSFIRNVELLSLMQKNCCQMQYFRKLMFTGIVNEQDIPSL